MLRVLAVAALASAMVPRTMERVVQTAKKEAAAGTLDGTVKMKLKRSAGAEAPKVAARVAEAMGCAPPRRVFRPAGKHELKHVRAGLDLHYSTDCAAAKEAGAPGTSAKPKAGRRAVWALESLARTDRALLDATHYDAINLDEAWEMGAGDPSIVVAVVDTGMDMDHPDLQKNVWVNDGEICGNGVDDDKNGYVDDCYGYNFADDKGNGDLFGDGSHGTHCAGTIAADNDNDLYVSGVAGGKNGNAGASLMTLVAFGQVSYGGFAEGIVYAADNGAKIVSNSWGYTAPDQYAEDELAAIDYADDLGVAVVFAAGNAGTDENWYPAYYDRAIAVAAVDDDGVAAYFTCFGDWIDVSAPGVGVLSTVAMSEGATDYYDGTKDDVLDCLYGTATDLDDVNGAYAGKLGAGLIAAGDFAACMKNGAPSAAPTLSLPPTRYPTTASPTATFSPTDYGCGRCDLVLTLVLVTDQYPEETGWSLSWDNPGGCRGDATARKSAGAYGAQYTKYTETVEGLCAGFEYTFTIADTYGDGILEGGSYVVTVGGADVAAGATFQYSESTESAYSFKVGVAREGGDMSWSYPACQASGQGAFFHVLTAADGLECGESYEILVMQGDAQTETIVARTLACDGSDDDAACVCDCGSDYEEDDCADSTSWYYKKSKDTCSDYVTKKSKNCKKKDEFKVKAEDASAAASLRARAFPSRDARPRRCPLTCGVCSSSDCEDSTSWYYKKSKKYGVDDVLAEDACPVTCGAC
ncbi:serine-type endopeptidase [Aureococcus anophagefferens]|nr:serine-type endopeptidase [Aureococcus anophagefferens]